VGYSGWDAGQLESEMDRRSWLVHPADRKNIMGGRESDLWKGILRGMGPEFSPLANFPEDPTQN
jgi:putative transcriptional regulator